LERLVAKNEEEYVQLALQLASDITALSNLRMSLRDLMSKSPVCDGTNFALGLESTYRNMWHRYCKGDVPSSKHMEMLQQLAVTEEPTTKILDPTSNTNSRESPPGSIKTNGFGPLPPMLNVSTCEENGGQLNQNIKSVKLS
jgi:protein O-GlcNAc transferase